MVKDWYMKPRVSELKKLVCLDIGQHNALEIFTVKNNTNAEISKELLNGIFTEFDRSSLNKNFTDRSEEVKSWLIASRWFICKNLQHKVQRGIYQSGKSIFK